MVVPGSDHGGESQRDEFHHILVALDGSAHSEAAFLRAVQLARAHGSRLTALHVAVPSPRSSLDVSPAAARRAENAARQKGQRLLETARAAANDVDFSAELLFGDPADVICNRGETLGADLIVVGSRGLGLLDRLALGSVSSRVVQCASCSVLVVRSPGTDET
jgi:nucleotide-binding universal stress UspA family protein